MSYHRKNTVQLPRVVVWLLIACIGVLAILPVRVLIAGVYVTNFTQLVDEDEVDPYLAPMSDQRSIQLIELASAWDPRNSQYPKALADNYAAIAAWADAMKELSAYSPHGTITAEEARMKSECYLERAISLDPINPDHHFALGRLILSKRPDGRNVEFENAVDIFPINSALRYAAALEYLIAGQNEKALEYAKVLARNDDSYKLENDIYKKKHMETRSYAYKSHIGNSFLFNALEIAWRASRKDPTVIMTMVPDTEEGRQIAELYLESKGVDFEDIQ